MRHAVHDMHANSMAAHAELVLSEREAAVIGAVKILQICTDRQVLEWLGFADMNSVRPRISDLVKVGILREVGYCADHVTGKRVRMVEVAQ